MALSMREVVIGAAVGAVMLAASAFGQTPEVPPSGPYLQKCKNPRIVSHGLLLADCPGGTKTAMQWRRCPSIIFNETKGMLDCGVPMLK